MTTASNVAPASSWQRLVERVSPFGIPRRPGEWVTDSLLFAISLLQWWWFGLPEVHPHIPEWFWPIDRTVGLLVCFLIWWTRRYPVVCALLLVIPGSIAITATFPIFVVVYRLGLLTKPLTALLVTALHIVCAIPYHAVVPVPEMPWEVWIVVTPLLYALALCIGLLGRSRRQVIVGLRESADRDRERYEERITATRREERERIAREMHDVLAHRISLLSVHAGAFEFRAHSAAAPSPEEVRSAASVIRENAHLAVEDLRELLALLRGDHEELGTARPQPRIDDLDQLVHEAGAAGQRVDLHVGVDPTQVRESVQRTVYRVVQESLTNARKHAPHAQVRAAVTGDGERILVVVDNSVPVGVTAADLSDRERGGNGLVGLEERVQLDGGTLVAGIDAGRFRVVVDLPGVQR